MFRSFFWGGFDCSAGLNADRVRFDHTAATAHDLRLEEDYRLLAGAGIHVVREGVCWPAAAVGMRGVEAHLRRVLQAAEHYGMDVVFDLCHFGYPDDVDVFSAEFVERFRDYSCHIARVVSASSSRDCAFAPVNEPSYWAWAGGHAALFAPHLEGRAFDLKTALVRAAIAAIDAIWSVSPDATIVSVDPICRVVAPRDRPDLIPIAEDFNTGAVLEGWDMLAGRLLPELGGSRRHLGVVGVNYYWTNQWEWGAPEVPLAADDDRRWSLCELVTFVWQRYGGDVVISETSHINEHRAAWIATLACEAQRLRASGVPLRGICLYPVLGMPHWHRQHEWLMMGLWDLLDRSALDRVPNEPALHALRRAQAALGGPVIDRLVEEPEPERP